jgi:hypothetical protein
VESLSGLSSARDLNVKTSGQKKIGGVVGLHVIFVVNFEAEGVRGVCPLRSVHSTALELVVSLLCRRSEDNLPEKKNW